MPFRRTAAVIALALLCSGAGRVSGEELTDDELVYTDGQSLWRQVDGEREPVEVARLGVPAELVRRIRPSVDGTALLLDVDGFAAWIDLTTEAPHEPRFLPCSTPASLSADGHRVVCGAPDGERTVVYTLRPSLSHRFLDVAPDSPRFGSQASAPIVVLGEGGVLGAGGQVLAPHRPDAGFLVAPSGQRAVGVYLEGKGTEDELGTLYTFRLDGKGARRKLIAPADPLGFSRDSRWVIVQAGERACVVRAVGGEYKCWNGFRALAGSTHGRALLVSRPSDQGKGRIDLYRARLDGPRSRPPELVREGVLGTAAFIPPRAAPPSAPPAP